MAKLFSNALPTRAPGDQYRFHPAVNTFLSSVVPQKEKERRNREKQRDFKRRVDASGAVNGLGEKDAFDPVLFLLTPNQMIENEYPIPSYFPVTVEAFMKGDQGAMERGNQVFLPWQHADQASGQEKGSSLPEGWKETKRADKAPEDGKYPVLAVDCEMVSPDVPHDQIAEIVGRLDADH
jgi:RNA exonuclease 1